MSILNRIEIDRVLEWTVFQLAINDRDRKFARAVAAMRAFAIDLCGLP
ncbi:hypothetical protein [Chamaesiphon sp. VAR_48_metabat_403]|nr:hypothetical protein [Chamaesiphon sp. VAR_48_metabat_403]